MEQEPISMIALAYRFKKRLTASLPYWLEQNVNIHICSTKDDPDGTRKAIFDLAVKYPRRIKLHTFDLRPLQRAAMYYKVITERINTKFCAFFDLDIIPPPHLIEKIYPCINDRVGITTPRVDLPDEVVNQVLTRDIASFGYNDIYAAHLNHKGKGPMKNEAKCFYGYLQVGTTESFRKASPTTEYVGVNVHDVEFRNKLIANGAQIRVFDKLLLLHLSHPRFGHIENKRFNL